MKYGSSSHTESVRVNNPNSLIIFTASYKTFFQYAGVCLTELLNKNALPLATNLSTVPSKLFLTFLPLIVPGLI